MVGTHRVRDNAEQWLIGLVLFVSFSCTATLGHFFEEVGKLPHSEDVSGGARLTL